MYIFGNRYTEAETILLYSCTIYDMVYVFIYNNNRVEWFWFNQQIRQTLYNEVSLFGRNSCLFWAMETVSACAIWVYLFIYTTHI